MQCLKERTCAKKRTVYLHTAIRVRDALDQSPYLLKLQYYAGLFRPCRTLSVWLRPYRCRSCILGTSGRVNREFLDSRWDLFFLKRRQKVKIEEGLSPQLRAS